MNETAIKGIFAAIAAAVLSLLGTLAPWVGVLIVAMALDYLTGISAAWNAGELSSKVGLRGILKKLGYLVIVAVAMLAEWVVAEGSVVIGVDVKLKGFIALLVIVWLLVNELISILENLGKLGVPYPAWMMQLLTRLKQTADQKGEESGD